MIPSQTFPLLQLPIELQAHVLSFLSCEDLKAWSLVNKDYQTIAQERLFALDTDGAPSTCTLQGRTSLCYDKGQLFTCLNEGSQAEQKNVNRTHEIFESGTVESSYFSRLQPGQRPPSYEEASPNLNKPAIEIWDLKAESDAPSHILNTYGSKPIFAACSGQQLCALTKDGTMRIWNVATQQCIKEFSEEFPPLSRFTCAEGMIFSSPYTKEINVRNIETGQRLASLKGHAKEITTLIHGEGKVFSGSCDKTIVAWDAKTCEQLFTLEEHTKTITSLSYKKGRVFSGDEKGIIKVWDVATRTCLYTLEGHTEDVTCLDFGHRHLFSGSTDKTIKVWDLATGNCVQTLNKHTDSVDFLACSPEYLVSGSRDSTTVIWNFAASNTD